MALESPVRLLIAAGGSGGHLFPAQIIAHRLRARGVEIFFAGAGLDQSPFFSREIFAYRNIDSPPLVLSPKKIWSMGRGLWRGFGQARHLLRENRFDAILGFGSFHTVAILTAGVCGRIPLLLHEANARPGKAVTLFAPFASGIAVQYEALLRGKWHRRAALTRMPLVHSNDEEPPAGKCALSHFDLCADLPTLLIFGGSQGAAFLNEIMPKALAALTERRFQVLHLAGKSADCLAIAQAYRRAGIAATVRPFEQRMQRAWSLAKAAICRAGSSTLAEIQHFRVPALLIPYPGAGGHQLHNAEQLVRQTKGALLIQQQEANCGALTAHLKRLLHPDQVLLEQLREALCRADQRAKPRELDAWVMENLMGRMR